MQLNIVSETHERAHRNARNNCEEAKRSYYWPGMVKDFKKWVKLCEICKLEKYERRPVKQLIGSTPIPNAVGESVSMDLFYIDNQQYVTSVDRYSKYLMVHPILTKLKFHEKMEEILTQNYPTCNSLMTDNDAVFVSHATRLVLNKYGIAHITSPVQHSTSNGEVERTHSTLIELIRCLTAQNGTTSSEEMFNAVKAYNETIHSVTKEKPIDVKNNPFGYPDISNRILANQETTLAYHNKRRRNREFVENEVIYIASNRRRKDASAYARHIVLEDLGNSVRTTKNKIFHKDSIKNSEQK